MRTWISGKTMMEEECADDDEVAEEERTIPNGDSVENVR